MLGKTTTTIQLIKRLKQKAEKLLTSEEKPIRKHI